MRQPIHRRAAVAALAALVLFAVAADAHDLFLRPADFITSPGSRIRVRVLNGTFIASEAPVARSRLRELIVVGPDGVVHPDTTAWSADGDGAGRAGKESVWSVQVGGAGTYLLGASVLPKTIRLTGPQFNDYLREDGIPDVLAARRASGTLDQPAHERYSKHVKALVRVEEGGRRAAVAAADSAFRRVLGYPAELIPLDDPYARSAGSVLRVRALVDGRPVSGQVLLAGGRTANGGVIAERAVRTDSRGEARIPLRARGAWYVKFIHMEPVPAAAHDSVSHESKWATLTFAVR